MNIIDIAVIALAVIAIIWGAWKGFIAQLVSILGVFIGIWGASKLTPYVTSIVSGWFPEDNSEAIVKAVVFVLLVIIIILICHLIGKGLEKVAGITEGRSFPGCPGFSDRKCSPGYASCSS